MSRGAERTLVIVTPHNEAIRFEFGQGFAKWHRQHYGRPAKVDWRTPGGTVRMTGPAREVAHGTLTDAFLASVR